MPEWVIGLCREMDGSKYLTVGCVVKKDEYTFKVGPFTIEVWSKKGGLPVYVHLCGQ